MRDPQHILITGASSGIGAALALAYARPGIRLSLNGRDDKRLAAVTARATAKGAIVDCGIGDTTNRAFMESWVSACHNATEIDLLIANAGISPGLKSGQETSADVYQVFNTNIIGVMNTVLPVIPLMRQRGKGQIALMASLASFRGFNGSASYCGSKAAVRVYGEGLRADLAPSDIAVNVICPGFIETPMTERNPFPMPFLIDANKAADIIIKGLAWDCPRIAFPWPIYALARFSAILPQDLINRVAMRVRKKPR